MSSSKITVIGTGYVGLVTGTCFAEMGHEVTCLDIDQEKISLLKQGEIPIYEPGLEEMVARNSAANRLSFTTDYQEAVAGAEAIFLSLPTPSDEMGGANVAFVLRAAKQLAKFLGGYVVIVNKSTVPVGTAQAVREAILEENPEAQIDVVSNPEFLKEGSAVADCMKPDRVIIGSESARAIALMRKLYSPFMMNHERLQVMDVASAELTKYAANAMLATRISFMNEMARLCEKVGADISAVRKGIGSDKRIGNSFLYAGAGYGGSCFPKDIRALQATARMKGVETPLLAAVEEVNCEQKKLLFTRLQAHFGALKGKVIGVWGLAFKPDTDDLREAPSLVLIEALQKAGAVVQVFDPVAMEGAKKLLSGVTFCEDEYAAAQNAEAVVLITEWRQFRFVDLKRVKKNMKGKAFFDGRNQYDPKAMQESGFTYYSVGRWKDPKELISALKAGSKSPVPVVN
ncbi:MAG: UDP-glucose/GDP-mannose dehydrogenase family protein [Candidatus Algichlamydia australiensis]|nr:UDP-glucose/GDP-mannose dehydrogenase family protein [Chlamydiales bacterium]